MSDLPLPQSGESHPNPRRARRNLEDYFPEHWKIEPIHDKDSNMEYGDDWIVKVTTETNALSGAAFYVQSKVNDQHKHITRRIGMRCKPSTLNYLHGLMLPVLLHCYHPGTDSGYWMWFDDYCKQVNKTEWREKKDVTVYIPTENILNEVAVKEIYKRVNAIHRAHMLRKNARIHTSIDPHFEFQFHEGEGAVGVSMHLKHPEAAREHPISFTMEVDEAAQNALIKSTERGEPVRFEANVTFHGIPSWLFSDTDKPVRMEMELQPNVIDIESHLRLIYYGPGDEELFRVNHIEMRLVRAGTKYKLWEGKLRNVPAVFSFELDETKPLTRLNFRYDVTDRSARGMHYYINLLEQVKATERVTIENLAVDHPPHILEGFNPGEMQTLEPIKRLVLALSIITEHTEVDFEWPSLFSYAELYAAEGYAELIQTGRTYRLTVVPEDVLEDELGSIVQVAVEKRFAQQILIDLATYESSEVSTQVSSKGELFGTEFSVPPCQYVCYCTELLNSSEVAAAIADETQGDDATIWFELLFDPEKSYMTLVDHQVGDTATT